jgi:type 1 glutamine amidotransferase
MLRRMFLPALLLGTLMLVVAGSSPAADAVPRGKIKLLMVHNGGHDFQGFRAVMDELLAKTGDFDVTVAENFDVLKAENIKKFDEVLFYGSGGDFTDTAQEKGLEEFVKQGGGMVGVHATDAHKKSDVYWRMIGGRFTTHGGGKFRIVVLDKKHPVMVTIEDFEISDETYRNNYHPEAKLHWLGRIDRGEEKEPMIWTQEIGKGRMFNTTLGHGKESWTNPAFQRLVVRGLYWAAGQGPKNP